jgi:predicted AAA+ superfamily ATPase
MPSIPSIPRFFQDPEQSFFLFGPRGTGKSTLVKKRFPNALYFDLLLTDTKRMFQVAPERILPIIQAEPPGQVIIIDEIQRVPELLSLVHLLIEEKRGWKFILTGSSARKLKRQGVDMLGGRALKKYLNPFMAAELKDLFQLNEALNFGMLPLRFDVPDPSQTLSSYTNLYIQEEVQAEGIVRDIEPFFRFLEVMSFSHGSVINISNISRECDVKRTTVQNWISILEDLLLCFHLPVFSKRAKRNLVSHPKFYFFDAGVYRSIRPRSVLDQVTEIDGASLEGLVAQHLKGWIDYTNEKHTLHYWRTKSGVEVDFILFGPSQFLAIEVKNSLKIHPQDVRSLQHFKQDYPEATTVLLYRGKDKMVINNILCLPCDFFLKNLIPNQSPV